MTPEERDLDPEDWAEFEEAAHRVLGELIEFVRTADDRPVWHRPAERAVERLSSPPPAEGVGLSDLWEELRESVLPHLSGNLHPRFFGWAHGAGTPAGAVAEMIAAFLNANLAGRRQAPVLVERQVVGWFSELLDFPERASGTLVSGTSLGNLVGLTVARDAKKAFSRAGSHVPEPRVYASRSCHLSVTRAAHLAGFPQSSVRLVATDAADRLRPDELSRLVAEDERAGHRPIAVVATVGTSGTGAIDPLPEIVQICRRHELWLHVDGAFGTLSYLSPEPPPGVLALPRADSIAFDFHKWLHVPYAVGCVLIRDRDAHLDTYAASAPYVRVADGELGGGQPWPTNFGPEMSRGFRGLKVWITLRHFGLDRLVAQIDQTREQAESFARWIRARSRLELAAPVSLNIVCFSYLSPEEHAVDDNVLQERIVEAVQARGTAAPSATRVGGRTCIRVAIFNHRTTMHDLTEVGEEIVATGEALVRD